MFRAYMLETCTGMKYIRRSKLHYTASGIITPISGRFVQETETYRCDDNIGRVMQF